MSMVSFAMQRKRLKNMNKSCIKKVFRPSTKAHDPKECEICGGKFKSEKDMNDNVTKRHENSIVLFILKCEYEKLLGLAMGDTPLLSA